jgi:hypothetical protein
MAHFFVEYDSLVGLLSHATSVTSDSALKDSDKTVVFMIHEDGDSIIAAKNSDLMVRVAFTPEKVEKAGNIQINSSELAKILGTYTSLSRTKVDSVEFRENETRVQVIVHESDLDEEQDLFGGVTSYSLDNIKIKDRLLDDLKLKFEEESAESVNVTELDMVLSTLIPVMDSKKGVNNNFIHFADDVIFVMDTRCQVFYKNILPEVLHNVSLRYTSVSYMKKMSETSNHLLMVLQGNKFAVRSEDGSIEAFINYIPVRFNYKPTYEGITKANGVILDRKFLKDILRRLSTMGADATFTIKEDGVYIRTNDFSRVMPINNAKGDIMGIEFKMKTSLLSYMIVGDDSIMSSDLFLYLEKATRGVGYQLSVSDDSGAFISNARIS